MKKTRDGYKRTEAGYIPNDWGSEKLNNLAVKITDGTHKTPIYTDEGIPFLRVTDIQSKKVDWDNVKHISEEEHLELIKRCKPERGDILYSKNGTIGIPKIIDWDREFSIFVSLCLIKLDKNEAKINGKYLEQYLGSESCIEQIRLRAKQGTVTNLHLEEIRELIIPLPPLTEQQKIADILSTVDEQIEQTDELIEKTKELKKGLMQRLLTKGIGHTEFKKTEVGEIPVEWDVKSLGELFEIYGGLSIPRSKLTDEGSYYLHYGDIHKRNSHFVDTSKDYEWLPKIDLNTPIKEGASLCTGDIVFADASEDYDGIGKSVVIINDQQKSFYSGLHTIVAKPKTKELDDLYKRYCFGIQSVRKQFISIATGATVYGISKSNIKSVKIIVPPSEEQKKISQTLAAIDEKIEGNQLKLVKLMDVKKTLMQKLLTGKIRVRTVEFAD